MNDLTRHMLISPGGEKRISLHSCCTPCSGEVMEAMFASRIDYTIFFYDRGYFKIEDIEAREKAEIDPYVPRPQHGPSVRAGLFRKDEFSYDPASDSFLCPAGQHLHPYSSSLMRSLKKINYRNSQACRDCAIRSQCMGHRFRSVSRLENEAVLDRMQARIAQRPDIFG